MDLKMEVYSPGLELLGLLEIQNSVLWERKAFGAGSFSLTSLITDESRTLLVPENIIWIEGDTAGIIEYIQEESGEDGPYITVKGGDLTSILDRRILWGQYNLSGPVPSLMHQLVDDCCIHPTRGDVEARVIPGLRLSDVPSGGASIQTQKTGGSLLEALEGLGEAYQVAFGVRFVPEVPCMEFWARPGVDRSIHQTVNEPVFYSTELDDVLSSEYSYNAQNYRNVALVAGEGEGKDRTMVTVVGKVEAEPEPPAPPTPPTPVTKYTITLLVDPAGGGVASGGGTVEEGKSITVTAVASSGFTFSAWQENGKTVSTNVSYTFTATTDRTLTAVFAAIIPVYIVTVSVDPAGSGTVSGGGAYEQGQSVTLTQAAKDGYRFAGWFDASGSLLSAETSYTFTPTANVTVTAKYAAIPVYTISTSIDPTGSGTVAGAGSYQEGTQVTLTAAPENDYRFVAWKENGETVSEDAEYTFTISSNRELVAVFEEVSSSRLPNGYTEVEYISLNSYACIPTNIQATIDTTKVVVDIMPEEKVVARRAIFIAFKSTGTYYFYFGIRQNDSNNQIWYAAGYSGATVVASGGLGTFTYDLQSDKRIAIEMDVPTETVKMGANIFPISPAKGTSNKSAGELTIGANSGSGMYGLKMKVYSMQAYIAGELKGDFVPCINTAGVAGLYNVVENTFHTASAGVVSPGPVV